MSDAEPRWDLLPHDPEQFFELPEDFDLGDLKRSYNRLIRRYKPEKHPAEFQQIRAAYERLNGALRYNISRMPTQPPRRPRQPQDKPPPPAPQEEPAPPEEEQTSPESPQASDPEEFAHEKSHEHQPQPAADRTSEHHDVEEVVRASLAPADPADAPHETYARLKYLEHKSEDDYVTLALLADVVHPHAIAGHDESFLDWLLAGLGEYPRSWAITSLVRQYLADERNPQIIAALLLRTVEVLPADRFQFVTEKAWDHLLREATFDEFRDCLDRCGAELGQAVDRAQLVFYVHILKFALWKADAEFLEQIFGTVEDHYHQLDRYAQGEFEMLALLRDYVAHRETFVARGPCCARIDQAMRDWCMLSEAAGDVSVLDCQYFINNRGKRLCDEFPDAEADLSSMLIPWNRIVDDVLDRLDEPEAADRNDLHLFVRDFLIRHSRRLSRTLRNNVGSMLNVTAFLLFLICVVAGISFVVRSFMYFYEWRIGAGLLDWLWAAITIVTGTTASLYLLFRTHTSFVYADVRRDLITLFRAAAISVPEMAAELERHERSKFGDSDSIRGTGHITKWMRNDAALQIFSLAQISLRAADIKPEDAPLVIL
jgi:hypothetical protein